MIKLNYFLLKYVLPVMYFISQDDFLHNFFNDFANHSMYSFHEHFPSEIINTIHVFGQHINFSIATKIYIKIIVRVILDSRTMACQTAKETLPKAKFYSFIQSSI